MDSVYAYEVEKRLYGHSEWWYHGTYEKAISLANAMYEMGRDNSSVTQVRIRKVWEPNVYGDWVYSQEGDIQGGDFHGD